MNTKLLFTTGTKYTTIKACLRWIPNYFSLQEQTAIFEKKVQITSVFKNLCQIKVESAASI